MNKLLLIALFIFLNACSFNIDSKYWNEKSDKKNDNNKLTEIIKKSNDIRLMTIEAVSYTHLTLPTKCWV